MRASRLLSTLLLLQSRGKLTAEQLAAELEVSVRTVYRDIDALSAAGVPVYADRGPAGGYQLVGGYRTRLTGLTPDEADALFFGGAPAAAAELGLGGVLAAAQLKLLAALPPELRDRAGRVRQRFHLDAPDWFRDLEHPRHLEAVADAVWQQRVIEIGYERWGRRRVTRRLRPYGLVLKAGVWYLVAEASEESSGPVEEPQPTEHPQPAEHPPRAEHPRPAERPRTYRVARIHRLEEQPETFERAEGFDLADYWAEWNEQYAERLYRDEAVVRLAPFARDLLGFYLGRVVARAAAETASAPDANGWVTARLPIESVHHATLEFLRFGSAVEVLEPVELRARLAAEAAEVAHLYEGQEPVATRG